MDHEIYIWLNELEQKNNYIYDALVKAGIIKKEEKKNETSQEK